jgi:uncharacterized protein (DUF1330 family)
MAGYWVVKIRVTDTEAYGAYAKLASEAVAKYGGRFLVRGGPATTMEGEDFPRNVVIEFPSVEQALTCYKSPEYQKALTCQEGAADRMFAVVEGV